jgi:hypothetical protein
MELDDLFFAIGTDGYVGTSSYNWFLGLDWIKPECPASLRAKGYPVRRTMLNPITEGKKAFRIE